MELERGAGQQHGAGRARGAHGRRGARQGMLPLEDQFLDHPFIKQNFIAFKVETAKKYSSHWTFQTFGLLSQKSAFKIIFQ